MQCVRDVLFVCGLPRPTIFLHVISKTERLSKKVTEYEMRVLIFSTAFVQNISHSKQNSARYNQKSILVFM